MKFTHAILVATGCLACCVPSTMRAGIVFTDNFDNEAVGSFPTNWSLINNTLPSNGVFGVTNNLSTAPSKPNVFQLFNPFNGGYEVARFFPDVTLTTGTTFVLRYDLSVFGMPNGTKDGDTGFTIALGKGSPGGFGAGFPGGDLRVFSDGIACVFTGGNARLANNVPFNHFSSIKIEVKASADNANTGTVSYFLNDRSMGTFEYKTETNATINGIRIDPNVGLQLPEPVGFHLDNVSVEVSP